MSEKNGRHPCAPPYASEREVERLSGLSDLLVPFALSDEVTIPRGEERAFVRTSFPPGREGVLFEWGARWTRAWYRSPVYVARLGLTDGLGGDGKIEGKALGPFKTAIGSLERPVSLLPHGLFFKAGTDVGLALRNGESSPREAAGYLRGVTWNERHARRVRQLLQAAGIVPPWPEGSVFDGP